VIGGSLFGLEKDFEAELRRLAQQLGIAGQTVFAGHRDDVPDCLAGLDVAVHASVHPEPFGLVLIEAMAAGTALVAADGGGAREIVRHGSDGLLVPPGDHEALAVALLDLCDDPPRRAVLAAAGERTVRERFDVTRMTRSVEALYRAVVRR
jgi:glycosyltransferase involved in cell wall biosynthesis